MFETGFFLISMLKNIWKISTEIWKQSEIYKTKGTIDTQGDNFFGGFKYVGFGGGGSLESWTVNYIGQYFSFISN